MDISLLALHRKERKVSWAGANNPLWIITTKDYDDSLGAPSLTDESLKLYEIKADKQPIGRYPNRQQYTNHEVQLSEGDSLYAFSDGYPDQFGGERGKKYKSKNFKRFLLSIQDQAIAAQRDLLAKEFASWKGSLEQVDDVCVIGVRV
jgi:serine phosphatase RsbU (regulator of sigma subunit)